ncbi:hypothetical protein BC938DRAFT_479735 [Jimgerdemannia flammicorona]|uniref:J domain-containing protein n=1 Tax=Jimgerdemannia flammicorona TaxID=994334 RepID=A0A433QK91_9FUNG|nr:hypothetical protein BC938DRAFT_479735 [Jimgerdemannia flammicorona]
MSTKTLTADVDYYDLLGVTYNSSLKEIQRAYRQKALRVHPDKNPSPDAAALFHALSQAHDVLSDPQAKLAYDDLVKARVAKKNKYAAMDAKRKAMKDDGRGKIAGGVRSPVCASSVRTIDPKLIAHQFEIIQLERLRAEGARRRKEKEEELRKQMMNEPTSVAEDSTPTEHGELDCTLKVKWKRKRHTLDSADLESIFSVFGPVDSVAVSTKKQGSALVVFKTVVAAHAALTSMGTNPRLNSFESIDWAAGVEPAIVKKMNASPAAVSSAGADAATPAPSRPVFAAAATSSSSSSFFPSAPPSFASFGAAPSFPSFASAPPINDDYETMTLMKMRRAERDRLEKEIREKDAAEEERET